MSKTANEVHTLRRKLREQELKLTVKAGMFNVLEYLESADQWVPISEGWSEGLTHPLYYDDVIDIIAERQSA